MSYYLIQWNKIHIEISIDFVNLEAMLVILPPAATGAGILLEKSRIPLVFAIPP